MPLCSASVAEAVGTVLLQPWFKELYHSLIDLEFRTVKKNGKRKQGLNTYWEITIPFLLILHFGRPISGRLSTFFYLWNGNDQLRL